MLLFDRSEQPVVTARRAHVAVDAEDVFATGEQLRADLVRNGLFHRYRPIWPSSELGREASIHMCRGSRGRQDND